MYVISLCISALTSHNTVLYYGWSVRINAMRVALRAKVEAGIAQSARPIEHQRDWSHITGQIGMFCFTGLSLEQVEANSDFGRHFPYLATDFQIHRNQKMMSELIRKIHSKRSAYVRVRFFFLKEKISVSSESWTDQLSVILYESIIDSDCDWIGSREIFFVKWSVAWASLLVLLVIQYLFYCPSQVLRLRDEYHIYCTEDGRFSVAGINEANVDAIANAIVAVVNWFY